MSGSPGNRDRARETDLRRARPIPPTIRSQPGGATTAARLPRAPSQNLGIQARPAVSPGPAADRQVGSHASPVDQRVNTIAYRGNAGTGRVPSVATPLGFREFGSCPPTAPPGARAPRQFATASPTP